MLVLLVYVVRASSGKLSVFIEDADASMEDIHVFNKLMEKDAPAVKP